MQFAFDDEQQTETSNKQLFDILEFIRIRRGEKRKVKTAGGLEEYSYSWFRPAHKLGENKKRCNK